MFGLIYALWEISCSIITGTKSAEEEIKCIEKGFAAKRNGCNKANVYTDRAGHLRDLGSGNSVMIDHINCESEGRDAWLRNQYGDPIRNLSKEIREEIYAQEVLYHDPNITVCRWKRAFISSLAGLKGNPYYIGVQYKDLKNGKIYVCRQFKFPDEICPNVRGKFYMDTETGLLVREADSQRIDRIKGKYVIGEDVNQRFIEYFNKKQLSSGYYHNSNLSVMDDESEIFKNIRMQKFFCNDDLGFDI